MKFEKTKDIYDADSVIAAISTSPGEYAIGIVRMSGKRALEIADKIFISKSGAKPSKFKTHTIHYGWIVDKRRRAKNTNSGKNRILDEVLLTVMKAPKTYTRQNIVEINCHGGVLPLKKILELLLENGARLAEHGEFTKRAFLNGRIDLAQAEAALDVIRAKTEPALQAAVGQLEGGLSKKISEIKNVLIEILANIEASLDFSYEEIEPQNAKELERRLAMVKKNLEALIKSSEGGCILREGVTTVICGKPNVGKSSLMNAFLREDKVIVTPVAGTTRDAIEDIINIKGIPLKIVDTAGIIEPRDLVEKEGIARSKKYIDGAHLILFVLDNSRALSSEDLEIIERIEKKPVIVVVNKTDLEGRLYFGKIKKFLQGKKIIKICAVKEEGIAQLEDAIKNYILGGRAVTGGESALVTNIRHKKALEESLGFVAAAARNLKEGKREELAAEDLRESLRFIGCIVGEVAPDEILDKIFEEFCIGK